jgi:hypothetical protein
MTWVSILFVTTGAMNEKDSRALTSVPMASEAVCSAVVLQEKLPLVNSKQALSEPPTSV